MSRTIHLQFYEIEHEKIEDTKLKSCTITTQGLIPTVHFNSTTSMHPVSLMRMKYNIHESHRPEQHQEES